MAHTKTTGTDIDARRARRWRLDQPPLVSHQQAADFIEEVGFALLFPKRGLELPALWSAVRQQDFSEQLVWGPDIQRMWRWKDELPERGLAWYGHLLRGQPSFLSPALLAALYPRSGGADDFHGVALSHGARSLADLLLVNGPMSAAVLRQAAGFEGKAGSARMTKSVAELSRALVVTHYGVEEKCTGWPSAVFELTARAFAVPAAGSDADRRHLVARQFLSTMAAATASELARAFGYPAATARSMLAELVESGQATLDNDVYTLKPPATLRPPPRGVP
jgi:hypothetical protein